MLTPPNFRHTFTARLRSGIAACFFRTLIRDFSGLKSHEFQAMIIFGEKHMACRKKYKAHILK